MPVSGPTTGPSMPTKVPAKVTLHSLRDLLNVLHLRLEAVDNQLMENVDLVSGQSKVQQELMVSLAKSITKMLDGRLQDVMQRRKTFLHNDVGAKLERLENEAKEKGLEDQPDKLKAMWVKASTLFEPTDANVFASLSLHHPTFLQELLERKVQSLMALKTTLSARNLKLTARPREAEEMQDCLWMELAVVGDTDATLCKMHLHDLELTVDKADENSTTKKIQFNELYDRGELELTPRSLRFKVMLEVFSGDAFVYAKYLGTPVEGSPHIVSLRMNQSFCSNQITPAMMKFFQDHDKGEEEKENEKPIEVSISKAEDQEEKTAFLTLHPDVTAVGAINNLGDMDESDFRASGPEGKFPSRPKLLRSDPVLPTTPASPLPSSRNLILVGSNSPMLASMRDQPTQQPLNHDGPFDPSTASTSATNIAEKLAKIGTIAAAFGDQHADSGILTSDPGVDVNSMQKNLSTESPRRNVQNVGDHSCQGETTMYNAKYVSFQANHTVMGDDKPHHHFLDQSVADLVEKRHNHSRGKTCPDCEADTVLQSNNVREGRACISSQTLNSEMSVSTSQPAGLGDLTMYRQSPMNARKCKDCERGVCDRLEHEGNPSRYAANHTAEGSQNWDTTVEEPAFDLTRRDVHFAFASELHLSGLSAPQGLARHPIQDITYVTDVQADKIYSFKGNRKENWAPHIKFDKPRYIICFAFNDTIRVAVLDNNALYLLTADGSRYKAMLKGEVSQFRGLTFQSDVARVLTTETTNTVYVVSIDALGSGRIMSKTLVATNCDKSKEDMQRLLVRYITYCRGYTFTAAMGTGQVFRTGFLDRSTTTLRKSEHDESICQFPAATGLAIDPAKNIIVASKASNTLSIVSAITNCRARKITLPRCQGVGDIVLQERFLYVVDLEDKCIKKYLLVEN